MSKRRSTGADGGSPLAIQGGPPAVPEGPPDWPPKDSAVRDQLLAAWADGSWGRYHGPHTRQLVERLSELQDTPYVFLCCSGTAAVELALRGLKVQSGDEVVLAAYDFPGNFRAVEAVHATPVLVDIDPQTWCLDAEQLEAALTTSTRAVIVSHLHGGLADMQQLTQWAASHQIAVIEDACQAPGAVVQGRRAGSWGSVGVLSFGGSKLLTAGRGGAVITHDASVLQRIKIYAERGNDAFPLSELQAAVLLPQLDLLQRRNERRRNGVERLQQSWQDLRWIQPIARQPDRGLPSYYKLALRYATEQGGSRSRAQYIEALAAEGVAVGPGFRGFVRRGTRRCRSVGQLPHATVAAASTVLMHHPALLQSSDQLDQIAQAFRKVERYWNSRSD